MIMKRIKDVARRDIMIHSADVAMGFVTTVS